MFKHRNAPKVTKLYNRALTPFARAVARPSDTEAGHEALDEVMGAIRPGGLYRQIRDRTTWL